ncbi:MAG TPA: 6-phosphofructokinase, partial [Ruminiclostridium sp.]|nr:6-phosphofructokinase [Ruminiclostridium sp.]
MTKNMLIGQSGGPTAAINSSLAGAVAEALKQQNIGEIYGAHNGIKGVLKHDFVNLRNVLKTESDIELLKETPAMALGSCRFKLPDYPSEIYNEILKIFKEYNIG